MNTLIPRIEHPELVFGFVAPIGADYKRPLQAAKTFFRAQRYDVIDIKVTDVFQVFKQYVEPIDTLETFPPQSRYKSYIKYGDQLRKHFADDSFLAATTIARVVQKRAAQPRPPEKKFSRTVYLLHQFKRREEIDLLRSVYGDIFFQISVYSRRGARVDHMARKFASGHDSFNFNNFRAFAEELVQIDENERDDHGQQVGKIFHDADFIVNLDQHSPSAEDQIERFFELLFSSNSISPTKLEHGMFLAKGAALRSLDLSRQVGACILDGQGQIISLGANEVPKAEGGTYWADGEFDDRDFKRGEDSNEIRKREILSEILRAVGNPKNVDEVLKDKGVRDSQLMDALEYARVIHGEMNAICDAARLGRALQGAVLYCTTFPCHICAKHIIAAGISKVVFLEPYPKSLTAQLHSDAAQIEGHDRGQYARFPAVEFHHFYGVTPRRYQELFQRGRRKNKEAQFEAYRDDRQQPLVDIKSPAYSQPEGVVLKSLQQNYRTRLGVVAEQMQKQLDEEK